MFEELEKRANGLAAGIAIAVIVLGRTFGGSLWGLIPLSFCIASGVCLWMKEVVRSGREYEWHSEKLRGETVCLSTNEDTINLLIIVLGNSQSPPRVRGMDECPFRCHLGPIES